MLLQSALRAPASPLLVILIRNGNIFAFELAAVSRLRFMAHLGR